MPEPLLVITYADHLTMMIQKSRKRTEKTHQKIKLSTVDLLKEASYHELTIDAICKHAGLAKGTFYVHFEDKRALVVDIMEEYVRIQSQVIPDVSDVEDTHAAFLRLNTWFSRTFYENVHIHRSLMQLSETIPDFTEIWTRFIRKLCLPYVAVLRKRTTEPMDEEKVLFLTYMLGNMLDSTLYAIYAVHRNPELERLAVDLDNVAQTCTILQLRAVFLDTPSDIRCGLSDVLAQLAGR